jgi:hypothetical protein
MSDVKGKAKDAAVGLWDQFGWPSVSLLLGLAMVGSVYLLPRVDHLPAAITQTTLTVLYAVSYVVVIVTRLKLLYRAHYAYWQAAIVVASLLGTLFAFALAHAAFGILDTTTDPQTTRYSVLYGLYLSVATFTTVGFGDFSPIGAGRAIASVQAFLGYVVLALIASTVASIMQEVAKKEMDDDEDSVAEEGFTSGPSK